MSHCAERSHENVDVLCTPAGLCESEHRHEQKRRGDVKNQVPPAVQDPDVRFRRARWNCRYGLRTGKRGNVLHLLERIESLNRKKKSTSLSLGVAVVHSHRRRNRCSQDRHRGITEHFLSRDHSWLGFHRASASAKQLCGSGTVWKIFQL